MEQTQERRNIRIINREVLKYMALFMMGIGHLITFVGIQHFRFLPVPVLRYCIYTVIMLCHQFICNGFMFWLSIRSFQWFIPEMIAITVITFFYNGKKGSSSKFSKWIFYVFYPAHLLLAFAIQMMLK